MSEAQGEPARVGNRGARKVSEVKVHHVVEHPTQFYVRHHGTFMYHLGFIEIISDRESVELHIIEKNPELGRTHLHRVFFQKVLSWRGV